MTMMTWLRSRRTLLALAVLAPLAGCRRPTPNAAPAPQPPPAPTAPVPAPPAAAILRDAQLVLPAGAAVPLARDGETVADPASKFRIELVRPCADARLILLDAQDALVAASGTQELGATTRLTLSPSAPLTPGSRYTLRLDGTVVRDFHDSDGNAYGPIALALRASGQAPPPEPRPKATAKAKRGRHRR